MRLVSVFFFFVVFLCCWHQDPSSILNDVSGGTSGFTAILTSVRSRSRLDIVSVVLALISVNSFYKNLMWARGQTRLLREGSWWRNSKLTCRSQGHARIWHSRRKRVVRTRRSYQRIFGYYRTWTFGSCLDGAVLKHVSLGSDLLIPPVTLTINKFISFIRLGLH